MPQITVVGPLASQGEAEATADTLGRSNHSVYSRAVKDAQGYDTDEKQWFVERDTDAPPQKIFGHDWSTIQAMQQRASR